jgi:hypothetical protein
MVKYMPLFSRQNAAEMGRRGQAARKLAQAQRAAKVAAIPLQAGPATDVYVASRLVRVREMLNRLDSMMTKESDPQRLDRLASAQSKLSEQERILDGRPLPGQRRPAPEPARRRPEIPRLLPQPTSQQQG